MSGQQTPDDVVFSVRDRVGVLSLDRPSKHNAISARALQCIGDALASVERGRDDVRVLLLNSNGRNFCTGADISDVGRCVAGGDASIREWLKAGQDLAGRVAACEVPVVVAIQGLCLAGGLELMLACDVAFAAASARFGDQHSNIGHLPAWGATGRLPRLVGERRALELMLSGRLLSSAEAREWGLVNTVVPDEELAAQTYAFCASLAAKSRSCLAAMKRMIRASACATPQQIHELERDEATRQLLSKDGAEGFAAFREKRKPAFD